MQSPKLASGAAKSKSWYRYYAGYSPEFVEDMLDWLRIPPGAGSRILDPWNGSGTTTFVANHRGHSAIGFDANPALVVIAKSRLLGADVLASLDALTDEILEHSAESLIEYPGNEDPLEVWFAPSSAIQIRTIERNIHRILVDSKVAIIDTERASSLAAFFYVVLFEATRSFLSPFLTSNPTWVKRPKQSDRTDVETSGLYIEFRAIQDRLMRRLESSSGTLYQRDDPSVTIGLASSRTLPIDSASIDAIITSPPYCTRIDYIMAFLPELAILGHQVDGLKPLRDEMIGTPTILATTPPIRKKWGAQAVNLLDEVKQHSSIASDTYYLKYFTQYFSSMWQSLQELRRVLRPNGSCVMIVQDSYYKDIHVDLPAILTEMATHIGWKLYERQDFTVNRTKASINPRARKYRSDFHAVESALVLKA
jgi:DNA modification methylase